MPKIIVTVLQLLPETTECGNFNTMSAGSVTALSSISGGKKVSNM